MIEDIQQYNDALPQTDRAICTLLTEIIENNLDATERKIWHAHPVWFIQGNPIVGYAKLKDSVQLLFWSGRSFDEEGLLPEGKFKVSQVRYTDINQVNENDLKRWLQKAEKIQWDYKNIVKRKGKLIRLG